MGGEIDVELPGFGSGVDFERFRKKARRFLQEREDHLSIRKLRWNEPLTATDLEEQERMLVEAAVGTEDDLTRLSEIRERAAA